MSSLHEAEGKEKNASNSSLYTDSRLMRRHPSWLLAGLFALICVAVRFHPLSHKKVPNLPPTMAGEPNLMLWAWETPEDLRGLDPSHAGVAYLSRELLLGSTMEVRSRHQQLVLPPGVIAMPVVRIETAPSFSWLDVDIPAIAEQVAVTALEPHARALQIDFDARLSERQPYTALLREVRRRLPSGTVLSITALTSWCGPRSWLGDLPIDEAVPMFFRMGGPASTRATAERSFANIVEPLCEGSAGISTDERWIPIDSRHRAYLFRKGSWSKNDLALINEGRYTDLQRVAAH